MIQKLSSVNVLAHSRFAIRRCPMADSQLILELFFLHIRDGCSLTVLLFFLMLLSMSKECCPFFVLWYFILLVLIYFISLVLIYLFDVINLEVIGVHCTHGVNRTGYIVCRYYNDALYSLYNPSFLITSFPPTEYSAGGGGVSQIFWCLKFHFSLHSNLHYYWFKIISQ